MAVIHSPEICMDKHFSAMLIPTERPRFGICSQNPAIFAGYPQMRSFLFGFVQNSYICSLFLFNVGKFVQQSLTIEPHNAQLLRALKCWSQTNSTYKEDLSKLTVRNIMESVPQEVTTKERAVKMIQGLFRGATSRHILNAGKLKTMMKGSHDGQKKGPSLTKLNARVGTLFECEAKTVLGGVHPVVLTARADWAGRIR
jgi:hypothetical protein